MKVLHVFNEINFSGAELMYSQAASLFKEKNIDIYAISTGNLIGNFSNEMQDSGYKLDHIKISRFDLLSYFKLYKYIRDNEFDVVHVHRQDYHFIICFLAWLNGCRIVKTIHNVFRSDKRVYRWFNRLERMLVKNIFHTIYQSISPSVRDNEYEAHLLDTVLINNWIDLSTFISDDIEKRKTRKEIREALGISDSDIVLLTVGRCTDVKNHSDVIKSLPLLISSGFNVSYIHIGCGDCEESERELAKQLNISSNCHFIGVTNEVNKYFHASDYHIVPSKFEGLGIVALESMAAKIPNILYNSPGLRDLIVNNNNGQLIEHGANHIVNAIKKFENDQAYKELCISNAYGFVFDNYDIKKVVPQIVELYNS
ncbi:glycosyltransferase family 4 protein [Vibrio harveyi]